MHRLLARQLKRKGISGTEAASIPKDVWTSFLSLVSESYEESDKSRTRIERSLRLMSEELTERNRELSETISKLEANQEKINFQATHDVLTTLPNRKCFLERLENITKQNGEKKPCAVLFIDLDDFKKVNDTCGHEAGDELLRIVTKRLTRGLRDQDMLARFGGDEFVAIIDDVRDSSQIEDISNRFLQEISRPCQIEDNRFYVSASIGISLFPKNSTGPNSLLRMADLAMYEAKRSGKNKFTFFNRSLERFARHEITIEDTIRRHIEKNELRLYYAPKVTSKDKHVVGLEATLVWPAGDGGVISRSEYFQVARKTGLIKQIQAVIFKEACNQLKLWKANGYHGFTLCIKVSNSEFLQGDFVASVKRYFVEDAQAAGSLIIKVSESVLAENEQSAIEIIEQIKALGVQVAMDNFGVGHSSLSYLQTLPIDYLKVAGKFIENASKNSKSKAILLSIINLAHSLDIQVIAGDVADSETLSILEQGSCDIFQGDYFYPSLNAHDVLRFLDKNTAAHSHI